MVRSASRSLSSRIDDLSATLKPYSKADDPLVALMTDVFNRRQLEVHFLFGVVSSAVGLALTEVSKQNKKIFIGTDHASTQLTSDKFQPYYFRVSNNTFQSMATGALYLKELQQTKPWTTIAYIGPDYALRP